MWKKGESGNPGGGVRNPAKPFLDALQRALVQDNSERLRQCAESLLDQAAAGEPWAVQMLADRLDGRAPQTVHVTTQARDMSLHDILAELEALGAAAGGGEAEEVSGEPGRVH